jgi:hypothetical protein
MDFTIFLNLCFPKFCYHPSHARVPTPRYLDWSIACSLPSPPLLPFINCSIAPTPPPPSLSCTPPHRSHARRRVCEGASEWPGAHGGVWGVWGGGTSKCFSRRRAKGAAEDAAVAAAAGNGHGAKVGGCLFKPRCNHAFHSVGRISGLGNWRKIQQDMSRKVHLTLLSPLGNGNAFCCS